MAIIDPEDENFLGATLPSNEQPPSAPEEASSPFSQFEDPLVGFLAKK